jgi:3-oxoacyl-[acyl-carrier protein] reductase
MPSSTPPQTVLVTGGALGIGRGIVAAFLAQGARVATLDLRSATSGDVLALEGDVSRPEDADRAVDRCYTEWGQLDVLVNNAGIYPNKPVVEMELADWQRVFQVNLDGPFLLSRAFARRALAAGRTGSIINISSGAARSGRVGAAHYCSSKAAVEMFTRVLAMELAPHGIRVNCIAPGLIDVRDAGALSPITSAYRDTLLKTIPMGRAGAPADIADVAVFLASDGARYMTGSIVSVDGGATAGHNQLPRSGT